MATSSAANSTRFTSSSSGKDSHHTPEKPFELYHLRHVCQFRFETRAQPRAVRRRARRFRVRRVADAHGPAAAGQRAACAHGRRLLRAEKFMGYNTTPLVLHSGVHATWLPDDRFWYRTTTENGSEAMLVDPATRAVAVRSPGVPRQRRRRRAAAGRGSAPRGHVHRPTASARGVHPRLQSVGARRRRPARRRRSRRTASRISATPPTTRAGRAATGRSCCGRPIRRRSRPSSRISAASARCTWWTPRSGIPTLQAWKYPLPGDDVVTTIQRVIIDVDAPRWCGCRCRPTSTALRCATTWPAAAASGATCSGAPTGSTLAFVSTSRDHKQRAAARRRRRRPARSAT